MAMPKARKASKGNRQPEQGWLSELPKEIFDVVIHKAVFFRVSSGTYQGLLDAVKETFEIITSMRLTCRAMAHCSKIRRYLYDVTWKAWALRDAMRFIPNLAQQLFNPNAFSAAHMSWVKDKELWLTITALHPADNEPLRRFLEHRKERAVKMDKELRKLNVFFATESESPATT